MSDIQGADALLGKLASAKLGFKTLDKVLLRAGLVVAGQAQRNVSGPRPSHLGVVTNRLRSSITAVNQGFGRVKVGTNVIYAAIHEEGGMIFAKRPLPGSKTGRKWLRFKIGERWVTTDRVRIPRRPYFHPAFVKTRPKVIQIVRSIYAGPLHLGGERA